MRPPCGVYCPDRKFGCHASCAKYKEYEDYRLRMYDERAKKAKIEEYVRLQVRMSVKRRERRKRH